MRKHIHKAKKWAPTAIFMLVFVGVVIGSVPYLSSDKFLKLVEDVHPFGPLLIILFTAISQVFAPVPGSPGVVVSFAVFGWGKTRLYVYLGSLLSAAISFYIARKFGRKWVKKFVGKKNMSEVDKFVKAEGTEALIISRIFGFTLYDYISYAAGLTLMPFKTYFLITAVFGGIVNYLYMWLFDGVDLSTPKGVALWYGFMLPLIPIFSIIINRYLKRKKR